MRTVTQTTFLCLVLTFLFACNKDSIKPDEKNDESFYKQKLTEMVHLSASPSKAFARASVSENQLKFDTYEQAFEFFDELLKVRSVAKIQMHVVDSVPPSTGSDISVSALSTTGIQYVTFTGIANNTVTVQNSWGTATIHVMYTPSVSVAYSYTESNFIRTYTGKQPLSSAVNNLSVTYSGFGAIESRNEIITAQPGGGSITGSMQGIMTIAGTETSFIISWNAGYSFFIPSTPTGTSTLYSNLSGTVI